ncbi:MAG: lipocalin family protein [Deltaproteobacteria bacterium]|nr:lipocalin family protein [Deltaproteobacteria bacterium]
MIRKLVCSAFLFVAGFGTIAQAGILPTVVSEIDVNKYMGKWYQVASTNPFFQANCVCATATYTLRDDGNVDVVNSCRRDTVDGALSDVKGIAYATSNPGKLNVVFGGIKLPGSNYWIIEVADDYSYAVVSSPLRRPIWILARTPELPTDTLDGIYKRLDAQGFPVNAIVPTLQTGCNN